MSREELRYAIRLARMKEEARKGSAKGVAESATPLAGDLPNCAGWRCSIIWIPPPRRLTRACLNWPTRWP
jgi:hypothetical protein